MKNYTEFINENLLNKTKMDIAFEEAQKYFKALHKHAKEDHIIDFMAGYLFLNYGIDVGHIKVTYKYIKHYLKLKMKRNKEL